MLKINLSDQPVGDNTKALKSELDNIFSTGSKIYRTYYNDLDGEYTFLTTAEKLHLRLGLLSRDGQLHLGKLLQEGLCDTNSPRDSLLLVFDKEKSDRMLVTVAKHATLQDRKIIFHLARAP